MRGRIANQTYPGRRGARAVTPPPLRREPHLCYNGSMKKVVSFDLDGTIVEGAYGNMVWLEGIPEKYADRYDMPLGSSEKGGESCI